MEGQVFKACLGFETIDQAPKGFVATGELVGNLVKCPHTEPARYEGRDEWHDTEAAAIGEVLQRLCKAREDSQERYSREIKVWREKLREHTEPGGVQA